MCQISTQHRTITADRVSIWSSAVPAIGLGLTQCAVGSFRRDDEHNPFVLLIRRESQYQTQSACNSPPHVDSNVFSPCFTLGDVDAKVNHVRILNCPRTRSRTSQGWPRDGHAHRTSPPVVTQRDSVKKIHSPTTNLTSLTLKAAAEPARRAAMASFILVVLFYLDIDLKVTTNVEGRRVGFR